MGTFKQFTEAKKTTYPLDAMMELVSAIKGVIERYSVNTREKVWHNLTGTKGQEEMKKLLNNPKRNLSAFRKLV